MNALSEFLHGQGQLLLFEPSFCGLKSLSAIPQIPAILVID
jgi:hypothetical protein